MKGKPAVRVGPIPGLAAWRCHGDHDEFTPATERIELRDHCVNLCRRCAKDVGAWLMRVK